MTPEPDLDEHGQPPAHGYTGITDERNRVPAGARRLGAPACPAGRQLLVGTAFIQYSRLDTMPPMMASVRVPVWMAPTQ